MTDNQQLDEILIALTSHNSMHLTTIAGAKQALLQWRDAEVARRCREARINELQEITKKSYRQDVTVAEIYAHCLLSIKALQAEEKL